MKLVLIKKILPFIYIIILFFPIYSTIRANFFQQINSDEVANLQEVFLIAKGFAPHKDFYSSYPPILHTLLLPIYFLTGPTWDNFLFSRIFMLALFIVRVAATLFFVKEVFNKSLAFILLPVIFFDVIFNYASIQIRPDNLMMTFLALGLLFLVHAFKKSSKKLFFLSGVLFSLSLLSCIKIAPAIAIISLVSFFYLFKSKKTNSLFHLISGLFIPAILFLFFVALSGTLKEMLQNILIDSAAIVNSIASPTLLGYWLEPHDITFGGFRNLNWAFSWILIIFSGAGAYQIFQQVMRHESAQKLEPLKLIISLSFLAQFTTLFLVNSVFMQYYLPIEFFGTILSSVCLYEIYQLSAKNSPLLKKSLFALAIILFILMSHSTYKTSQYRTKYNLSSSKTTLQYRWSQIPELAYTFPNLLFRFPSHPIIAGYFYGDIPDKLLNRLPSVSLSLEEKKVPYLFLSSSYMNYLKTDVQAYINTHYKRVPGDEDLWTRIQK